MEADGSQLPSLSGLPPLPSSIIPKVVLRSWSCGGYPAIMKHLPGTRHHAKVGFRAAERVRPCLPFPDVGFSKVPRYTAASTPVLKSQAFSEILPRPSLSSDKEQEKGLASNKRSSCDWPLCALAHSLLAAQLPRTSQCYSR